jgi:hypothetical protein
MIPQSTSVSNAYYYSKQSVFRRFNALFSTTKVITHLKAPRQNEKNAPVLQNELNLCVLLLTSAGF